MLSHPIVKIIVAVIVGVVTAMFTIAVVEAIGHRIYPPPTGVDMNDPAIVAAYVASAPPGALVTLLIGWFLGALLGGTVAALISRRRLAVGVVTGFVVAGVIANATMIPHPWWLLVAGIALPLLAGLLVARRIRAA